MHRADHSEPHKVVRIDEHNQTDDKGEPGRDTKNVPDDAVPGESQGRVCEGIQEENNRKIGARYLVKQTV